MLVECPECKTRNSHEVKACKCGFALARFSKENNERNRILSPDEYTRLLAHCPAHIKPVVKVAYHTGAAGENP